VERALARPIPIDGRPVRVVHAHVRPAGKGIEIELTLAEGRTRIVRRMAEAIGLKVEWLHRTEYGPVRLGTLAEGRHRPLTRREVAAIEELDGAA
jgi:23S rRNA pseudouridine2605 synthase